jgi:hypothetical protein
MADVRILRGLRRMLGETFVKAIAKNYGIVVYYSNNDQKSVMDRIRAIRQRSTLVMTDNEAYQMITLCRSVAKVPGDIAELGVYKGASAILLNEEKNEKHLHLFDTFEGLPEIGLQDDSAQFAKGDFSCPIEAVKSFLKDCTNVYFHKGLFPGTAGVVSDKRFSFVNMDLDLYEGTRDGLEFFYPRMATGGIILVHDYTYSGGVRKAVDDFFRDKDEPVLELSGTHGAIVCCGKSVDK